MTPPVPHLRHEPATPEWALAVLRDAYRYAPYVSPDEPLTAATTVDEWSNLMDFDEFALSSWRPAASALNALFGLDLPDGRWRDVLKPAKRRTMGEACAFAARHAARPVVEPADIAGVRCKKAGAFRAVVGLLERAGLPPEDAARIAPSSRIEPYAGRFNQVFFATLPRITPGALPAGRQTHFLRELLLPVGVVGTAVAIVAAAVIGGVEGLLCLTAFGVTWAAAWRTAGPSPVEFGHVKTFRDLCERLCGPPPIS